MGVLGVFDFIVKIGISGDDLWSAACVSIVHTNNTGQHKNYYMFNNIKGIYTLILNYE